MPISVKGLRTLDGGDRFYEYDEKRYPSVTTVLKYCIPKPALSRWMAKLVAQSAYDSHEEFAALDREKAIKFVLGLADEGKDVKANLGQEVHAYADAMASNAELPVFSEAAAPYIAAYEAFQYDVQPTYVATELTVFNDTYGYAGTADIYAVINGKVCVIDIKTGSSIWPEVGLQLAAYSRGEFAVRDGQRTEVPVAERGYVLHLSPAGYELRRCVIGSASFNAFVSALDLYNWLREDSKYTIGGLYGAAESQDRVQTE